AQLQLGVERGLAPAQLELGRLGLGHSLGERPLGQGGLLLPALELLAQRRELRLAPGQDLLLGPQRVLRLAHGGLPARELRLARLERRLAALELGEQVERLLRGATVAAALPLQPLGLRARALLARRERRLALGQRGRAGGEPLLDLALAHGDRLDARLELLPHAVDVELGGAEVALAGAERLLAVAEGALPLGDLELAGGEARLGLGALAAELPLALGDARELLRDLGGGVGTLVVRGLELRGPRLDLHAELGEPRLLGDELGPELRQLPPLARDELLLLCERALALGELGLA